MSYNNGSYVPGAVLSALGMLSHRILPATLGGRHDCCPEDAGKDSTGRGWEELWLQSPPLSSWADPPESMRTTATPDAPFPGQRFPKASYTECCTLLFMCWPLHKLLLPLFYEAGLLSRRSSAELGSKDCGVTCGCQVHGGESLKASGSGTPTQVRLAGNHCMWFSLRQCLPSIHCL